MPYHARETKSASIQQASAEKQKYQAWYAFENLVFAATFDIRIIYKADIIPCAYYNLYNISYMPDSWKTPKKGQKVQT